MKPARMPIPSVSLWCSRSDSNRQITGFKPVASTNLATRAYCQRFHGPSQIPFFTSRSKLPQPIAPVKVPLPVNVRPIQARGLLIDSINLHTDLSARLSNIRYLQNLLFSHFIKYRIWNSYRESNPDLKLRRLVLYPLSYRSIGEPTRNRTWICRLEDGCSIH